MDERNPAPEIVGCDMELAEGGGYLITHKGSGDTAIALTADEAEIEGIVLRVAASWKTGDPA